MRAHLIEVGPNAIRRLCCGGAVVEDAETKQAAFESIDDTVALVDLQPVTVESLWHTVMESVDCGAAEHVTVVHPSWWSSPRVDVVNAATRALTGDAAVRPRSWLLMQAAPSTSAAAVLVVEIADDFVVVIGATTAAEARRGDSAAVAEAVVRSILESSTDVTETVVIDAPATVHGSGPLATAILRRLPRTGGLTAVVVEDIRLRKLAGELKPSDPTPGDTNRRSTARRVGRALTWATLAAGALIGVDTFHRHAAPRANAPFPTAIIVEGHVAVEVPAQWSAQRVVAGPGSARVQVTSPADPEVALHVTQSRVASTSLDATAQFLERAIDAAPVGVFVDFNPAARGAGHPVVTYREVRTGHDIRWTVWVDKAIRISIGCQSRSGRGDAPSQECERAIRSARALD